MTTVDFVYATDADLCVLPEIKGSRYQIRSLNALLIFTRRWNQMSQVCIHMVKVRPSVVHLLGIGGAGPRLTILSRVLGSRLVVSVHDLPPRSAAYRFDIAIQRGGLGFLLADRIFVHGEWSRDALVSRFGQRWAKKVALVEHPLYDYGESRTSRDETRKRYRLPEEATVLLFFGSLRPDKGLEHLLEALAAVGPEVHLWVVGHVDSRSHPDLDHYVGKARAAGVGDRVSFLDGWLPDDEIPGVFQACDLVVAPYTRDFAGQSGVLAVARRYGVPAIVSSVAELPNTQTNALVLEAVPPSDAGELAAAIRRAVQALPQRQAVRAADGPTTREWTDLARTFLRFYE